MKFPHTVSNEITRPRQDHSTSLKKRLKIFLDKPTPDPYDWEDDILPLLLFRRTLRFRERKNFPVNGPTCLRRQLSIFIGHEGTHIHKLSLTF
jgi:hypothetical protein